MRKLLVAFAAASLLLVAVVASASGSTGPASTASPTPRGSAAPPKLGYYAGIECSRWSCGYWSEAREAMKNHCGSLMGVRGYEHGYVSSDVHGYNIVRHVYVSTDRFPETCDNGWCIQGEWFSASTVQGKFRNPNSVYADYKAEWFAS